MKNNVYINKNNPAYKLEVLHVGLESSFVRVLESDIGGAEIGFKFALPATSYDKWKMYAYLWGNLNNKSTYLTTSQSRSKYDIGSKTATNAILLGVKTFYVREGDNYLGKEERKENPR